MILGADTAMAREGRGRGYLKRISASDLESLPHVYDVCRATIRQRFELMRDALNATGRQIVYAIDDWGTTNPYTYGEQVCCRTPFLS